MRNSRSQFLSLLCFLGALALLVSNGFVARISAQREGVDVFTQIEPIGDVLDEILKNYVHDPEVDKVVEGALKGMMNALDEHSSYISPDEFQDLTDETQGQFEGIGVTIQLDDDKNIVVFQPIEGAPAMKAGIMAGDIIVKIDDVSTKGMSLAEAAQLIKGPRGTVVTITVLRPALTDERDGQFLDIEVKRGKIPLESISEARVLDGGIGYIRITDFKRTTADEMRKWMKELEGQGMKSLVLDLRWNSGGLLNAAPEVSELFLPPNMLVTYTRGREKSDGTAADSMMLFTQQRPIVPASFPLIVLTNKFTASSSEIVTGALQYHKRALIVGEKSFGKGSVQTIIPLRRPDGGALRLTTALYYTPAEVTIHKQGIRPDVEVPMTEEEQFKLLSQMRASYIDDPSKMRTGQNHGSVTGDPVSEETVEDKQLLRAVELLREDPVFENLIQKYHKDTRETQVAASPDAAAQTADAAAAPDTAAEATR